MDDLPINFDFALLKRQCNDRKNNSDILDVLSSFKCTGCYDINFALREQKMTEDLFDQVDQLNNIILSQKRSKTANVLYRGIYNTEFMSWLGLNKKNARLLDVYKESIGECVLFRDFLSTTYNPRIALAFCNIGCSPQSYNERPGLILKFKIPPNFPMLAIDEVIDCIQYGDLPHYDYDIPDENLEDEILLPNNLVFRIINIRKRSLNKKTYYIITLDPSDCTQIQKMIDNLTEDSR